MADCEVLYYVGYGAVGLLLGRNVRYTVRTAEGEVGALVRDIYGLLDYFDVYRARSLGYESAEVGSVGFSLGVLMDLEALSDYLRTLLVYMGAILSGVRIYLSADVGNDFRVEINLLRFTRPLIRFNRFYSLEGTDIMDAITFIVYAECRDTDSARRRNERRRGADWLSFRFLWGVWLGLYYLARCVF